jgi:hypothetical protein
MFFNGYDTNSLDGGGAAVQQEGRPPGGSGDGGAPQGGQYGGGATIFDKTAAALSAALPELPLTSSPGSFASFNPNFASVPAPGLGSGWSS